MPGSLEFALVNTSQTNDSIYAFVTGIHIQSGQRCLLKSNGKDLYFPSNPPSIGSPLAEDCAITLGGPGSTRSITVPQLAGGRLWFSRHTPLVFLLNPGPALVEPSVLNPSDPNAKIDFSFCEFTLNDAQIYANISFVDFVPRLPIGIALETASGNTQHVSGLQSDGLDRIATSLAEQSNVDNWPWHRLILRDEHDVPFRVLNATHGEAVGASFKNYYEPYIDRVWSVYASRCLSINTQTGPNSLVSGGTKHDHLYIGNERFARPTTEDVLGCNSGPFSTAGASQLKLAMIPRLAAGFVRSCLLDTEDAAMQPSGPGTWYKDAVTNHYARVVHETTGDGKGYAFAYDDVQPDGTEDVSGKVNAGDPTRFVVSVGGGGGAASFAQSHSSGPQAMGAEQACGTAEQGSRGTGMRHKLGGFMQKVLR